ncbi:MAG TPA: hypothetical protein VFS76_19900 [Pyrinomonadaceae bacterium]|nr:hypothetical protein [Pyrinomonadaceae bacterium]
MKLIAIMSLLAVVLMGSNGMSFAQQQKTCQLNLVGTWKAQTSPTESVLYTFDDKGMVKVMAVTGTAAPREISTANYEITLGEDNTRDISFTATGKNKIFGKPTATVNITSFDDSSMSCTIPGVGKVRWTRVDPNRYFIIFVARNGEFYDKSGSAFPVVVKLSEGKSTFEGAGIYSNGGKAAFGTVPANAYKEYLREARGDSEVILRLEINSGQYERASKIVADWQRRAREGTLLYDYNVVHTEPAPLNNILLIKAVSETLNLCRDDIDLYKLDYAYPSDWITNQYGPEFVPFFYFKELKRRNEARHIEYKKFQELVPLANFASR